MHLIRLKQPEISPHEATFRWEVEPPTAFYRESHFTLRFPASIDLRNVPRDLWWTVALCCLHTHWIYLRPCRVEVPFTFRRGEREFWARLLEAAIWTLETYHTSPPLGYGIDLIENGPPLPNWERLPDQQKCAASFSGGKDSLCQAGLLREIGFRPIIVTTTSPSRLLDHITIRRREVLTEAAKRLPHVEVHTAFRKMYDNSWPKRLGYNTAANEVSDTFLYFSATLVAGVALGATHFFLASETEVQETTEERGRVAQHRHFMYSVVTQRAIAALLRPLGLRYCSLTSPLHSAQVQEILCTRYPDLAPLQYSCFSMRQGEAACCRCSQCLRIALGWMVAGRSPGPIGLDLISLMHNMADWEPRKIEPGALPRGGTAVKLSGQIARNAQMIPAWKLAMTLAKENPRRLISSNGRAALAKFQRLRKRLKQYDPGTLPGYRKGFLRAIDPLVRDRLAKIYASQFEAEDELDYTKKLLRGHALVRWIIAPLSR